MLVRYVLSCVDHAGASFLLLVLGLLEQTHLIRWYYLLLL
jgi:hypothetical protein